MEITTIDSNQARKNWRKMLDMASKEIDIVITRYNQPVVTMLNYEDYLSIRDELVQRRKEREARQQVRKETFATMLASENVLSREWNSPEEDDAWQNL